MFMRKNKSLQHQIISSFLFTVVPLFLIFTLLFYVSGKVIMDTTGQALSSMTRLYSEQISQTLRTLHFNAAKLATDGEIVILSGLDKNLDEFQIYKNKVNMKMGREVHYYSGVNCMALYLEKHDELLIDAPLVQRPDNIPDIFHNYKNRVKPGGILNWIVLNESDNKFLILIVNTIPGIYVMVMVDIETLLAKISFEGVVGRENVIFLVGDVVLNRENNAYSDVASRAIGTFREKGQETASISGYMCVYSSLGVDGIGMMLVVDKSQILTFMPVLTISEILMVIFVLVMLALLYLRLNRKLLTPMRLFVENMFRISENKSAGVVDMDANNCYREIGFLINAFNNMIREISSLKVDVYKEQLKQLQMQIKPHFYLNTLNTIYNLVTVREYETTKKLIVHLTDYLRNMMNITAAMISVEDEIENVNTYIEIHRIRYGNLLDIKAKADILSCDVEIPIMTILTFVENSIIHGLDRDKGKLTITVDVSGFDSGLEILITDTGRGFGTKVLADLNNPSLSEQNDGRGIGIQNVRRRLALYFKESHIDFFEREGGGACVRIRVGW